MTTLFLNNKYTNWYQAIIANAVSRENIGYTERHHIIPKCLGGNNKKDNLVDLTAREHYIVHALLPKCLIKKEHKHKLLCAFRRLHFSKDKKFTSRLYEILKPQIVKAHSELVKGKPQRKRTEAEKKEHSERMKEWVRNMSVEEIEVRKQANIKSANARTGVKRPEEVCEKISKARTGVFNTPKDYGAWLANKKAAIPRQVANTDQVEKGKRISEVKLTKNKKYSESEKCNLMITKMFRNASKMYLNYPEITEETILDARRTGLLTRFNQISIELLIKYIGHIPLKNEVDVFIAKKGK